MKRALLGGGVLLLLGGACSKTNNVNTNNNSVTSVTQTIQPDEESVIVHPEGAVLTVPAGAVDEPTDVTVRNLAESSDEAPELPDGSELVGQRFAFEPHGTTFNVPIALQLAREGASDAVVVRAEPEGEWMALPTRRSGIYAEAATDSFSYYAVVKGIESPSGTGGAPNMAGAGGAEGRGGDASTGACCSDPADCPSGICLNGACQDALLPSTCWSGADCSQGNTCIAANPESCPTPSEFPVEPGRCVPMSECGTECATCLNAPGAALEALDCFDARRNGLEPALPACLSCVNEAGPNGSDHCVGDQAADLALMVCADSAALCPALCEANAGCVETDETQEPNDRAYVWAMSGGTFGGCSPGVQPFSGTLRSEADEDVIVLPEPTPDGDCPNWTATLTASAAMSVCIYFTPGEATCGAGGVAGPIGGPDDWESCCMDGGTTMDLTWSSVIQPSMVVSGLEAGQSCVDYEIQLSWGP